MRPNNISKYLAKIFFIVMAVTSCAGGQKRHHIFQEKAKKNPSLVSQSRADKGVTHDVIFAISQSNMDQLTHVLEDLSDPSSSKYGKHWSKSEVAEFTANKRSYSAVMEYLQAKEGVDIYRQSLYGEYIFARAPVHVWEDVFATTFQMYESSSKDKNRKQNKIIRAEEYSLPVELDGHVSTVLNTIQFHGENAIKKRYKSDANVPISKRQKGSAGHSKLLEGATTSTTSRRPSRGPTTRKPTRVPSKKPTQIPTRIPTTGITNIDSPTAPPSASLELNIPIHVPYYSTWDTNSANFNTKSFTFRTCASGYIYIADCDPVRCSGSSSNDQYIRLYNSELEEVAYNDNRCGLCSVIDYPTLSDKCHTYTLQQGCQGYNYCSGNFTITLLSTLDQIPTPCPVNTPTLRPNSKRKPTPTSEPSSLYSIGSVTPRFLSSYYNITSNTGSLQVSQAVYETDQEGFSPSDLTMFQTTFGLPQQAPKTNQFGDFSSDCSSGYCYEGNLDVQYIMGIAQNVETTYDYELTDQYDFLTNWIISVSNTATPANVYSISWGEGENYLSTSFADVFNTELIKLGVMGSTVLASSGDDGAVSSDARGNPSFCGYNPLFPASSPYVVAVGGTNGPEWNQPEVACQSGIWSNSSLISSGGGFSNAYTQPSWQKQAVSDYLAQVDGTSKQPSTSSNNWYYGVNEGSFNVQGRAYPDVALLAHNYKVVVNGVLMLIDGTSASAPVMAAFVSLVNAQRKSKGMSTMGYINPFLYKYYANFTNDITSGDNKCTAVTYGFGSSQSASSSLDGYYSEYSPQYYSSRYYTYSDDGSWSDDYYSSYQPSVTCCSEGFFAAKGWDPVTGLGSINFDKFLTTAMNVSDLQSSPQTSSSASSGSSHADNTTLIIIIVAAIAGSIFLATLLGFAIFKGDCIRRKSTNNSSSDGEIAFTVAPWLSERRTLEDGPADPALSPEGNSSVTLQDGTANPASSVEGNSSVTLEDGSAASASSRKGYSSVTLEDGPAEEDGPADPASSRKGYSSVTLEDGPADPAPSRKGYSSVTLEDGPDEESIVVSALSDYSVEAPIMVEAAGADGPSGPIGTDLVEEGEENDTDNK